MQPLVSVIIITYNHEKYIKECIESVLEQDVKFPIEILISDDASTDSTPEILQYYQNLYSEQIKLILRKENVGATQNSYDLLVKAKGKYLAFCEGDDFWCDKNKLQLQYEFMEKHPEYIGCSHRTVLVDKDGLRKKKQKLYWISEKKIFRLKDFQGIFLSGHISSSFRRNIYILDEDFSFQYKASRNIGDRTAMLIYLMRGNFYFIDKTMSCYRQIAEAKAENLSSKLYIDDRENVKMDFEYTLRLEQYAQKYTNQKINFDYHKCELLLRILRNKSRAEDKAAIAKDIYNSIDKKYTIFFMFIKIVWRKVSRG